MWFIIYQLFWTIYFAIIWFNAISIRADGWYAAYIPHWADGAAHLSYISSFAFRHQFPLYHPLFIYQPFSYSFAADYLGGLLVKAGLSLPLSYNLLGLILSLILTICLWKFLYSFLHSAPKTLFASSLFYFAGGMGWKYLLFPSLRSASDSYFFSLLTQVKDTDIVWLNTIVGELIPQRSFLLGLPLGLILLYIFISHFVFGKKIRRCWLFLCGIIFGLMPIIHPHTAMMLISAIIIYGSFSLINSKAKFRQIFTDLLIIAIPSLIIGLSISQKFIFPATSSEFFHFFPGWLASKTQTNWFIFWFDNWGLYLPLALMGTLRMNRKHQLILMPFWLWFILSNLFLFQPYDWDNSKILTWVYLMFTIPVTQVIFQLIDRRFYSKLLVSIISLSLIFSGSYDAISMLDIKSHSLRLLNQEELTLATYVRQYTPDDSVILTSTTHRNWVPIATGRQILSGYLGWMWTYGINADQRIGDMTAIYGGFPQANGLLNYYGINYIIIGPEEKSEFKINQTYFMNNFPIFYQTPTTTIYQIN